MTSAYGSDAIWDVFDDSVVRLHLPNGTTITYGVDPHPFAEPLFGVTAWNPGEERPVEENQAANVRLAARLDELGIERVDAVGSSPDEAWSEPGFVLIGTDEATALAVAREFGQLAIHAMCGGKLMVVKTGIANRQDAKPDAD